MSLVWSANGAACAIRSTPLFKALPLSMARCNGKRPPSSDILAAHWLWSTRICIVSRGEKCLLPSCRVKMPIAELCQVKIPSAKLCRVFNSEFYSAFLLETRKQHKHTRTTHTHIHDALKLNQRRWQKLSMFYYTHSNVWIYTANLGNQGSHWKEQNSFKCFRENFVEV